jgi:hypothetical protein
MNDDHLVKCVLEAEPFGILDKRGSNTEKKQRDEFCKQTYDQRGHENELDVVGGNDQSMTVVSLSSFVTVQDGYRIARPEQTGEEHDSERDPKAGTEADDIVE